MSRNHDIDRLIDAGLTRYSAGDLDGALVAWEQVLAIEPMNPQATSYLGYVRVNYEALQHAAGAVVTTDSVAHFASFTIDDNPQYVIGSSELDSASVVTEPVRRVPARDSFGDDWFFEDDVALGTLQRSRTQSLDLTPASLAELSLQFSLEDDEAPGSGEAVSFESLTTEYAANAQRSPLDHAPSTRPTSSDASSGARMSRPPQLEVRVRSPSSLPNQRSNEVTRDPSREVEATPHSRDASTARPIGVGGVELGASGDTAINAIEQALLELEPLPDDASQATDDLISSLPIPRRVTTAKGSEGPPPISAGLSLDPSPFAAAPGESATQQRRDAVTRPPDVGPQFLVGNAVPANAAGEIGDPGSTLRRRSSPDMRKTVDLPVGPPIIVEDMVVDAPKPEQRHGLRAETDDDNLPTRQSARATTARSISRTRTGSSTNRDPRVPPRADPIDACAAQILDEVDAEGGRTDEAKDDRIRRRVTALLARAALWNKSDAEKAVCAVELALSEDPNSALAQKLIHRNRDAIMTVFQNYLGNLQRRPQLERPLHELGSVPITPRAAFLLSRIDGELTLDEILDVSGMPRLEAYRHLCQLFLRKILG